MYMSPHAFGFSRTFWVKFMEPRTLALGATGGSLSALFLHLLAGFVAETPINPIHDCPICPVCLDFQWEQLDLVSVGIGVAVGLLLCPFLDLVHLLRGSWKVWLQSRLTALSKSESRADQLYKIL